MPAIQMLDAVKGNRNVPSSAPGPMQNCDLENSVPADRVIVFFIGGAGDKEAYYTSGPFENIVKAQDAFDPKVRDLELCRRYLSFYRGYNEVCGSDNIKKHVLQHIPSKRTPVYIVGHSLGGWNGAHLSSILTSHGYIVKMLITLDPVGEGALVWVVSKIHASKPSPKAEYWINILAQPKNPDQSDGVADLGERWAVKAGPGGPNLNYIANVNHYDAIQLFIVAPKGKKSASDLLYESIRKVTSK